MNRDTNHQKNRVAPTTQPRVEVYHKKPTRRRGAAPRLPIVPTGGIIALAGLIVVLVVVFVFLPPDQNQNDPVESTTPDPAPSERRVSFTAVGDNLPEILIGEYGDSKAGEMNDGLYDFTSIYEPIKPYVTQADLSYVCFETHAGSDEVGPQGYPSFNTNSAMVDAIYETGFDMISSATNHSYDWGYDALEHSANLWKQKDVLFTGTATNEVDAATIQTIERNGITFSLLNYTYGVNGYEESDIPAYAINYMHEDRIRNDIAAARQISDFVLVAMHWGTENQTSPDENQQYYAQLIADAGADIILGSHPHVIGAVERLQGSGGTETLVVYSLGNFLSRHESPSYINELEGMLQCDFVIDAQGKRIENATWIPLVNHCEDNFYAIYALKDYTAELAARHRILSGLSEDPLVLLETTSSEVVGSEVNLDV